MENMNLEDFKQSINDSKFSDTQIKVIWEFYVTKALVSSASQKRKIEEDYGYKKIPVKEMKELAGFNEDNYKALLADKIDETLKRFSLLDDNDIIENIEEPRCVFALPYIIEDEKKPKSKKSEGEMLLEHIRNCFAHGNTYFFNNGMMLLEDKNGKKINARILIKQKTLLDWIMLIDKDNKYYVFKERA